MAVERPIAVQVDRHEHVSEVPSLLARYPQLVVESASLSCGDYAIGSALGIERKTAQDLARSIVDGRLFSQLGALRKRYKRPVLHSRPLPRTDRGLGLPEVEGRWKMQS